MKHVVLGVTGGIAAYKALDIVSGLKKEGIDVNVVMTESSQEFVRPLSFQSLSQNPVVTDMFKEPKVHEIAHISLAQKADVICIAPATANIIGKLANGIADDFLSTMCLATRAHIIIAPAMNTNMLNHPVVKENTEKLKKLGMTVLGTGSGRLACGDVGEGKLLPPEVIREEIMKALDDTVKDGPKEEESSSLSLRGKTFIVTAGPTSAPVDPVRVLTNRSSGKTGYAIAEVARDRGANVVLITGSREIPDPFGINTYHVTTNEEMYTEILKHFDSSDCVIMAAAVSDYRIKEFSTEKIKKTGDELTLTFIKDRDILKTLGKIKSHQKLIGFAAESSNILLNAATKLKNKNLDLIVSNDISKDKVFGKDRTHIYIMGNLPGDTGTAFKEGIRYKDSGDVDKKTAASLIIDSAEEILL